MSGLLWLDDDLRAPSCSESVTKTSNTNKTTSVRLRQKFLSVFSRNSYRKLCTICLRREWNQGPNHLLLTNMIETFVIYSALRNKKVIQTMKCEGVNKFKTITSTRYIAKSVPIEHIYIIISYHKMISNSMLLRDFLLILWTV